jgi:hypothetical protein
VNGERIVKFGMQKALITGVLRQDERFSITMTWPTTTAGSLDPRRVDSSVEGRGCNHAASQHVRETGGS